MPKPRLTKQAEFLTDWERLLAALEQNAEDFPDLQGNRQKLQDLLEMARSLAAGQAQHAASKQTVTREMQAAFDAGQKVAHVLRVTIRERYGSRSEKLAEFRLQPFRSRTQPPKLPPPTEAPPTPTETVP
jgi:hypothetical protein